MSKIRIGKFGKTVIAILLLTVAAYAILDFWAWHDLQKFKRDWEAKGEHFDFKSFVPPPVPDDQNFALTPIVATSYEWILDKSGHEIKPRRTNVVQQLMMDIYHYGNGGTLSNIVPTNGDWRIGRMCDLKSWQAYYRTPFTNMILVSGENAGGVFSYWQAVTTPGAILTNDFPFPPTPTTPAADVLLGLGKYDSDIEELRVASRLPYSRFPLNYDAEPPQPVYLMHLASLKYCCQTLQLRAIAELENDESQKALDDVMLSLRLVDSIHAEPSGFSQHMRSQMVDFIIQVVWEGLAKHKWTDGQLSTIEQEFRKLDFLADCELSLRCDRNEYLTNSDLWRFVHSFRELRIFVHDLADSGFHSIETEDSIAEFERQVTILTWYLYLIPKSWCYHNQLIIGRTYQEKFLPVIDSSKHLFSPQKFDESVKFTESLPHSRWNFMARRFLNGSESAIIKKFVYAQESVDLACVACALERCKLANGNYPETLDALAPQYIYQVPHDIIGGQPLHYRRTSDGSFLLYSVGWNEKDDGGVFVFREHSTWAVDDARVIGSGSIN
jgi:hypothetical protein